MIIRDRSPRAPLPKLPAVRRSSSPRPAPSSYRTVVTPPTPAPMQHRMVRRMAPLTVKKLPKLAPMRKRKLAPLPTFTRAKTTAAPMRPRATARRFEDGSVRLYGQRPPIGVPNVGESGAYGPRVRQYGPTSSSTAGFQNALDSLYRALAGASRRR